jgi:hypothetical protein
MSPFDLIPYSLATLFLVAALWRDRGYRKPRD